MVVPEEGVAADERPAVPAGASEARPDRRMCEAGAAEARSADMGETGAAHAANVHTTEATGVHAAAEMPTSSPSSRYGRNASR